MTGSRLGRVAGSKIELEEGFEGLEGKLVRVTVEVVEEENPAVRATNEAPPDERPYSPDERAGVEAARRNGQYISTDELRARLAAHHNKGT